MDEELKIWTKEWGATRKSKEECKDLLQKGSVVFLSGGNTLLQIKFIIDNDLVNDIKENNGIVMGLSAGALNMAKEAVCFAKRDRQTTFYPGIGRTSINIEPHFDVSNQDYIANVLYPVSMTRDIYAIADDSAIIVKDSDVKYFGSIYHISEGITKKLEICNI